MRRTYPSGLHPQRRHLRAGRRPDLRLCPRLVPAPGGAVSARREQFPVGQLQLHRGLAHDPQVVLVFSRGEPWPTFRPQPNESFSRADAIARPNRASEVRVSQCRDDPGDRHPPGLGGRPVHPRRSVRHRRRRLPDPGTYRADRIAAELAAIGSSNFVLAPVNGIYGLLSPERGIVDTQTIGRLFGQIGVIVFIMAIGAFISISFATRSLEVAVAALANRLRSRGWLLISRRHGAVLAARLDHGLLGGDPRLLCPVHPADGRPGLRPAGHRGHDHRRGHASGSWRPR